MPEKFRLSDKFIKELIGLAGGLITPARFDLLFDMIETEAGRYYFTEGSEANFIRMVNSLFDKRSFLSEAADYPHHIEILTAIAANSNYLTDIIVRNPEYIYQIFDNEYLAKKIIREDVEKEISETLTKFKSFSTRLNFIRLMKRRYLLRIGINDILSNRTLSETATALSHLANSVCGAVFNLCYEEIKQKNNVLFEDNNYVLCSLGKLGGLELNYSSDVDFILYYEKNQSENGKEYHEILTDTVHLFVNSCMNKTDRGFLYRVDFRLRPDGRNSPLCRAYGDYMRYYETRGEDWERQMLIKSGFTTGNRALYDKFMKFAYSFIYPSTFTESPVNRIRAMKAKIEKRSGEEQNIKLFSGGIRDIEFSVQALQLINGGKFRELRTGNTLVALAGLADRGLLTEEEVAIYKTAYIFYRRIEHYLQLMNDTQTHIIPESGELPQKLANYFGFESLEHFNSTLGKYRNDVRKIYNSIMQADNSDETSVSLDDINFRDKNRAEKNLKFLRTGAGLLGNKNFDSRTINLFEKIFPTLKDSLAKSSSPDLMLENFSRIISAASFPSIWYQEFQNSSFLEKCLKIFEYSQKASDLLVTDKRLAENLLSRKVFIKNLAEEVENFTLKGLLFTLAVQFAAGLINHDTVSDVLRNYIAGELQKSAESLKQKYQFCIVGLGSFATGGMTFESDADLVVIARNIELFPQIQEDFQKYLADVKLKLYPIEVDFRLRPEGKKSPLVSDITTYKTYLSGRARIWEYQAFSKISFVAGDISIYNEFADAVKSNFSRFAKEEIYSEMKEMLKKINADAGSPFSSAINLKKSRGGLVTLDFALHSLILSDKNFYAGLLGKSFVEKTDYLAGIGLLERDIYIKAFNILKTAELSLQVLFNQSKPNTPSEREKSARFNEFIVANFGFEPEKDIAETLIIIKNEFVKITG